MHFDFFSDVYDRIRKTWFGSWAWNASTYGLREFIVRQNEDSIAIQEFKAGTSVRHGRAVNIYNDGYILDKFYKEGIDHGPQIHIYTSGNYQIGRFENATWRGGKVFNKDGTPW